MMKHITPADIVKFLKTNIEPIENYIYDGKAYRAAAHLTDGTYLPCVIFRNNSNIVKLAIKRLKEEKKSYGIFSNPESKGIGYSEIVKTFVANGNRINYYDIAKIEESKYAFPKNILIEIKGETTMGWTGFVAKMKDGKSFAFGTSFHSAFFDMPKGYNTTDIIEIVNHSYIDKEGTIISYKKPGIYDIPRDDLYSERPFFDCYLDESL